MQSISRDTAQSMIQERDDVTVIESLPSKYFDKFHLPGAKNVPLDENFDENVQEAAPDKSKPVVVYCMDAECDASPKAAQRMEELGYSEVYDYEAGKVDWKEAGLPVDS